MSFDEAIRDSALSGIRGWNGNAQSSYELRQLVKLAQEQLGARQHLDERVRAALAGPQADDLYEVAMTGRYAA